MEKESVYKLLFKLLRVGLGLEQFSPTEVEVISQTSQQVWSRVFSISQMHGISALCYDAIKELWQELKVPKMLFIQWTFSTENIEKQYNKRISARTKLYEILENGGLRFLEMKGEALAQYYPNPTHRVCTDIDIYLGDNYNEGLKIFDLNKVVYKKDSPRHDHVFINGIIVENHLVLSEFRIRKSDVEIERILQEQARISLGSDTEPGGVYPTDDFNAIFLPWHSSAHFMFENIPLKQIVDWAIFLMKRGRFIEETLYRKCAQYSSGRVADIITVIAIKQMGFDSKMFPDFIVKSSQSIDTKLTDRVYEYIISPNRIKESSSNFLDRRIRRAREIWENRWKYSKVYKISLVTLYYRKAVWFIYDLFRYKKPYKNGEFKL